MRRLILFLTWCLILTGFVAFNAHASTFSCENALLWPETMEQLSNAWGERVKTLKTSKGEVSIELIGTPERVVQLDHLGRESDRGHVYSYSPTLSFVVSGAGESADETFLFYPDKTHATARNGEVELSGTYRHASGELRSSTSIWAILGEGLRSLGADPDERQPTFDADVIQYRTTVSYSISRTGALERFTAKRQRFVTVGLIGYWKTEAKFSF